MSLLLALILLAAPAPIAIGAALPLTGPEARSGSRQRDGLQLAIELANAQGGVEVGGQRVPLELRVLDDASDAATDVRQVEELVAGGAKLLAGTFNSALVEAGSAAAERLRVPYVAPSGASRGLYQRGFKYLFGLQAPVEQMANTTLRWVEEQQLKKKLPSPIRVAVLAEKTPHGKEYAEAVRGFAGKTPRRREAVKLVLDEAFPLGVTDPAALLARVRDAHPDVLLIDAHLPDYLTLHAQSLKAGICTAVISYGARGPEPEARQKLKDGADYVVSAVWWNAQMHRSALVQEFVSRFEARYHHEPEWYEALGYEAGRALVQAIHIAGSSNPEAVRLALSRMRVDSILPGGWLAFPENYGYQAQYFFVLQQNLPGGTAPIIYPAIAATADGVAPNPRCARAAAPVR